MKTTLPCLVVTILLLLPGVGLAQPFRLPVDNEGGKFVANRFVIGVDHDPVYYGGMEVRCIAYDGEENFPNCYDGHRGTDFILRGGFTVMDMEVAWVVAAADGVVIDVEDGHYDRCHASVQEMDVTCDGHEMISNYVLIEHNNGIQTRYKHLKADSIVVGVGDFVTCGQRLGLIGSSGESSMPHVHFEVTDAWGNVIDPYAGVMSQPESYWVQQNGPHGLPAERCAGRP